MPTTEPRLPAWRRRRRLLAGPARLGAHREIPSGAPHPEPFGDDSHPRRPSRVFAAVGNGCCDGDVSAGSAARFEDYSGGMTIAAQQANFRSFEESTAEDWAIISPQLNVTQSFVPAHV